MTDTDVLIVGAGPAGLAAALAFEGSGHSVIHVEARDRIGGRTHTLAIGTHTSIDVGAHWLHASKSNPLAREAKRLGVGLYSADQWPIVMDGETPLNTWHQMKLWRAWRKIDKGIVRLADDETGLSAHRAVDQSDRWQRLAGELHGNHACGMALSNVDATDFSNALDSEDRFVEGGYGALVAAAGRTATPRLGVTVQSVVQIDGGVRVETTAGTITARTLILTIPSTLIANGSIKFEPGLPESHREAAHNLPHGTYERLVFTLGNDSFSAERDRAVILLNQANKAFYLLAGGGGNGVHFADFGGDEAYELAANGITAMAECVRAWLQAHLGAAVANTLKPLFASNWSADPLTLGGWSVARPGKSTARVALQEPIDNRIWFAGEATSIQQWGTVGGAWLEGTRAAAEAKRTLEPGSISTGWFSARKRLKTVVHKTRPRNLT
jgi:monoamine oxidase